jgi:DNA-binding beta-propeller fold protein YncE
VICHYLPLLALLVAARQRSQGQQQIAPLTLVADVPLPGGTGRFDYQSLDQQSGRLYIAHMGPGRLLVFDTRSNRVIRSIPGFPRVTAVFAAPSLDRVYVSAAGSHQLAVLHASTLQVVARLGPIRFPDGIAYAPEAAKVFVSDEYGRQEIVVDARGDSILARIPLGGEAGNTQFDSVAKRIWVAVQTRNQLVEIEPVSDRIVGRHDLAGADHPHGFYVDAPRRLAYVSCERNSALLVVDLNTKHVIATHRVAREPDVLAFDAGLNRLYVAAESGVVTVFEVRGRTLHRLGEYRAPGAHSVSVDPASHRVYLPLENVGGKPVLRILAAKAQQ